MFGVDEDTPDVQEIDVNGNKLKIHTGLFINGKFISSNAGKKFPTINPATGEVICEVYEADKADVDAAVAVAQKAYDEVWSKLPPAKRADLLWKLGELFGQEHQLLAEIEALDNGMKLNTALGFTRDLIPYRFKYAAGWCDKIEGKVMMNEGTYFSYTRREPYGVIGAITPWNAPFSQLTGKICMALSTGNTIVVKTSEKSPLSALAFCELVKKAGIPDGVINIVSGFGPTAGAALVEHPTVPKVTFTGSVRTGKKLVEMSSKSNLKKISLELGGKSPAIVFEDADIEQAAKWATRGVFALSGQLCIASSRCFVHESVKDQFIAAYKKITENQGVGDQFDPNSQAGLGPLVDEAQLNVSDVMRYIDIGSKEATLVTGGKRLGGKGFYVAPTIFADVKDDATIMKEEIFGPVVAINTFKTEDEVIKRANNTTFGLGASIFTENITRALRVSSAIQAGTVWVNCANVLEPQTPFGGYKESGWEREYSSEYLNAYTQVKAVKVNVGNRLP
ncbi:indole-3-acetaldehyde dehydrogenase [Gonapodya prolifera JEL478]|uniref:Indole-3-acetaldehyde dehydrogenase n=1 Tax=Gonapodya prolifera (strain JEL478) TaxID=1344416 RepID=A0A139APW3_GONPJ|nr:indole-3-acetaldehyde dehydrogenase [Gonapodya prolifera JEL478]|eukprot:KXS18801.1 indole-3-acetaldehyde dehydrogenase [Gonapodya prolifera JEL478]